MRKSIVAAILGLAALPNLQAQSLNARLEACNAIKNSKQRLECLKAATAPPAAPALAPAPTIKVEAAPAAPEPLTVDNAAAICERIIRDLQPKHGLASEYVQKSTSVELAVTWPADEGVAHPDVVTITCLVGRLTRKVTSIESGGRLWPESVVADLERDARFREEIKSGKYDSFVGYAKASLTRSFKDPGAVQYRGLFISREETPALCGEVNGKNSYGAYVGFRRFYASAKEMLNAVEPESDTFAFDRMWRSMCTKGVEIPAQ